MVGGRKAARVLRGRDRRAPEDQGAIRPARARRRCQHRRDHRRSPGAHDRRRREVVAALDREGSCWIRQARSGGDGGVEFVPPAQGARGEMRSPSWSPDGRRMVFHRDVDTRWPPVRPWASRDPSFRLERTGVFPSYSPTGDRLVVNDEKAGILHNSILMMKADGSGRAVLFGDPSAAHSLQSGRRRGPDRSRNRPFLSGCARSLRPPTSPS